MALVQPRSGRGWVAAIVGLAVTSGLSIALADNREPGTLQKFMRKKLDSSAVVMEGLALEDHDLIRKGAAELLEMSKSEMWNVLTDEDYRNFNREFRSAVRKLDEAAEQQQLENALLQWNDVTKSCVECHKYVRKQRATLK